MALSVSGRKPGRPPKYLVSTRLEVVVPAELKKYLRELSVETGKSISELVVEALTNYYHEVKVEKLERKKEKSAIEVYAEAVAEQIKEDLVQYKRIVKTIEEAIASGNKLRKGSMLLDPKNYAKEVMVRLDKYIIAEIVRTERMAKIKELPHLMKEALELKKRLKKAIELALAKSGR